MKALLGFLPFLFTAWVIAPITVNTDDIIGTWEYEVSDTPPEHAQGEITISKDGELYIAEIKTAGGMIKLDNLDVDGNKVAFSVLVDGSDVQVEMTFEGDIMTGKAESYDGVFRMKGKRKV